MVWASGSATGRPSPDVPPSSLTKSKLKECEEYNASTVVRIPRSLPSRRKLRAADAPIGVHGCGTRTLGVLQDSRRFRVKSLNFLNEYGACNLQLEQCSNVF
jgi:hypothetical protein